MIRYIGAGVAAASLAAYIYFNPSSAEDDTDAGSQVKISTFSCTYN